MPECRVCGVALAPHELTFCDACWEATDTAIDADEPTFEAALRYQRDVLVSTLVYHQQTRTSGCHCGWGTRPRHLGRSWAEHVADIYEMAVQATDG